MNKDKQQKKISPTDKLNSSFKKHDSNYVKVMKQTWGNKNDTKRQSKSI